MARFMVKASEFKNVFKAVNDRQLESLKKEIIEILKKQDEKELKKAIDYFNSQEEHYTHLEKSLISGKWIQKAGYGVGTVRIWKGKKYKKIAPGKWARVFDKEGRGTNIAIGKLIARVQKIDNVEDLMAFVMQNKQRFVDENGIDLPVLDKLRAAVDAKNNGTMGSKGTSKPAETDDLHYSADAADHERNELVHKIKSYSKDIETYEAQLAKKEKEGEELAKKDKLTKEEEKRLLLLGKNRSTILQMIKERNAEVMQAKQQLAEYDERKRRVEEKQKENEAEKTQNRSEDMKGNQNARKFGADWEEKRKEIQEKITENTDKLLEDNDNAKDTYEKLQNQLNKRKADAELYRKYLGNQEEPEDVKDFRKWCDDVIEQYRKEVTNTPSKEIISKWEETARNTPTEKLEEVYNGKQKVDYSNEYENFIDSTIINEFAKDKDLVFPQPYTMLKDIATRKFDNSDKIRLEVIKKELEKRNKGNTEETSESSNKKYKSTPSFKPVKSVNVKKSAIAETTKIADGKVSLPGTKEVKNEIKQLISCLLKDKTEGTYRDVMKHVYYDGENMIATDGKQLKVINVGEMDGIEPNKYLSIDTKGKDIIIEQDEKDYGRYPAYKRVMPDNNNMQIRFDNNVLKEKIEEMKKDGSIDMEAKRISLKVQDGNVYLDNVRVGSADGVKFEDDRQFIDFNYKLLTNSLSGDESIMAVSDNPDKAVTISTSVSDNIFMPLRTDHNEVDYESNRKAKAATDEYLEKKRAQDAADKEDRQKRSITDAAKSEILKDKPEGVTDNDYEDLIDYCNDFYAKLGYDNSTEKGKRDIKRTIDNAINKINGKDFEILEMIENPDNKVSRKVFETITAMKLGSNRESAKEAWRKWVGKEAMQKHNDEIAAQKQAEKDRIAAEKKAADDADNEQYHGFLDGKTAAGKGKAKQILAKRARFDNKVYSYQELVDHYINELGGRVSSSVHTTSGGKDKTYYGVYDKEGRGYEIPKIVFDYGKHIQGDNSVEKSFVKDFFFLNEYEHDLLDEEDLEEDESLFNDYSAEQPELFNSTEMKVQEAFNRCGCCL